MSEEYVFDYDENTKQVLVCDNPLGELTEQRVLDYLRTGMRVFATFSPKLNRAVHYYTIDYTVCPRCKGEFHRINKVDNVELGHCSECRVPLYRYENQVYIVYNNQTGAKTWHNLLKE